MLVVDGSADLKRYSNIGPLPLPSEEDSKAFVKLKEISRMKHLSRQRINLSPTDLSIPKTLADIENLVCNVTTR